MSVYKSGLLFWNIVFPLVVFSLIAAPVASFAESASGKVVCSSISDEGSCNSKTGCRWFTPPNNNGTGQCAYSGDEDIYKECREMSDRTERIGCTIRMINSIGDSNGVQISEKLTDASQSKSDFHKNLLGNGFAEIGQSLNSPSGMALIYGIMIAYTVFQIGFAIENRACTAMSVSVGIATVAALIAFLATLITNMQLNKDLAKAKQALAPPAPAATASASSGGSEGEGGGEEYVDLQEKTFTTLADVYKKLHTYELAKAIAFGVAAGLFAVAAGIAFIAEGAFFPCVPAAPVKGAHAIIMGVVSGAAGLGSGLLPAVAMGSEEKNIGFMIAGSIGAIAISVIYPLIAWKYTPLMAKGWTRGVVYTLFAGLLGMLTAAAAVSANLAKLKHELVKDIHATMMEGCTEKENSIMPLRSNGDQREYARLLKCFCYDKQADYKELRNDRMNNSLCLSFDQAAHNLLGIRKGGVYVDTVIGPLGSKGCVTLDKKYDPNCDCKRVRNSSGENYCMKTNVTTKSVAVAGSSVAGLAAIGNSGNSILNGTLPVNMAALGQTRAQMADASKFARRSADEGPKKDGKSFADVAKLANATLADLQKALPKNAITGLQAASGAGALKGFDDQLTQLTTDKTGYAMDGKKTSKDSLGNSALNFQGGGGKAGVKATDNSDPLAGLVGGGSDSGGDQNGRGGTLRVDGREGGYKLKSISSDKGGSLWEMISNRYKKSAYQRLF
ncbi:MAG: hypothetical protein HQK52_11980 [Oligoflexia bacterium]|nr:hypothetical protein [Oligoflexia bacterium]